MNHLNIFKAKACVQNKSIENRKTIDYTCSSPLHAHGFCLFYFFSPT